jgi:tRNA A37 methylthiotransferase MiaB
MPTFEKRGRYWRVRVRRRGYPVQSRTFDTKARADAWARSVEGEMDRGLFVDRTEGNDAVGRSEWDAPEIDQEVVIHGAASIAPGVFVQVRITDSAEFDLFGTLA